MIIHSIIFAISSSIDSLGIGITYGIKNTKISFFSKIILFSISIVISFISIFLGNYLINILTENFANIIGGFLLFLIGIFIIIKTFIETNSNSHNHYDFNNSNLIDPKEAFFLGIALSIDSFGIGFSLSLINVNSIFFPILVSIFQLIFLNLGIFIGNHINRSSNIPDFIWSIISGILLICIGLIRINI